MFTTNQIKTILTTNMEPWKEGLDIQEIQDLNEAIEEDDLDVIVSPVFYDDIHDYNLDIMDIIDDHFIGYLTNYKRESFIALHNIYNGVL